MHNILWDFDMQTDHLIPKKRPDDALIYKEKRTRNLADFTVPADYKVDHKVKMKENKMVDKYLDLTRKLKKKKAAEHEGDGDTYCSCRTWNDSLRSGKDIEETRD